MKIGRVLMTVMDFAAIIVAFVAGATALAATVIIALYHTGKFWLMQIREAWAVKGDRWFLIAVAISVAWCWFRWRVMSKPYSYWKK